jgi:magnesium-transporting ATPase (P-type)
VSSLAAEVRGVFASPLVLLLLVATGVSALVGDLVDAAIVVVIVLAGAALNFAQTYRSRVATDRLRAAVAPTASVLRDGVWREHPRVEVVPGDVVRLSAGYYPLSWRRWSSAAMVVAYLALVELAKRAVLLPRRTRKGRA